MVPIGTIYFFLFRYNFTLPILDLKCALAKKKKKKKCNVLNIIWSKHTKLEDLIKTQCACEGHLFP